MVSKGEVLQHFAVERQHDRGTLERYLKQYPQFTEYLVDWSRELAREIPETGTDDQPLTDQDAKPIDSALRTYHNGQRSD